MKLLITDFFYSAFLNFLSKYPKITFQLYDTGTGLTRFVTYVFLVSERSGNLFKFYFTTLCDTYFNAGYSNGYYYIQPSNDCANPSSAFLTLTYGSYFTSTRVRSTDTIFISKIRAPPDS